MRDGTQLPASWLEKAASPVFPGWAARHYAARLALQTLMGGAGDLERPDGVDSRRIFEAVWGSRYHTDWTNITLDADAANVLSLQRLRNSIRDHTQRSGYIAGPLKRETNNVVGHGIKPQARVREDTEFDSPALLAPNGSPMGSSITKPIADRFNYQIEKAWHRFVKKADAKLLRDFYTLQGLAYRAMRQDGECLVVMRSSMRNGRIVPLCCEVIEIDRLWTPPQEMKNPLIRWGIEHDEEGVPIRYFVLKRHPGSWALTPNFTEFETLDAWNPDGSRRVIHLFDLLRPGQSRGYSSYGPALGDLQDVARYREAKVVAARIQACLAAFIKKPAVASVFNQKPENTKGQVIDKFEPGMIKYLNPGEEVTVSDPKQPGNENGSFTKDMLQGAANAVDMPYEVFANDLAGLNYSNARTVLIQAQLSFKVQQLYLVKELCEPVWENFVRECVGSGIVDAPGFGTRAHDYLRASWITPGWQWVDPLKESEAASNDLETLLSSLSDILAGKGDDWEETLEQRAKELARVKELEKKYDITMSPPPKAPNTGNASGGASEKEGNG